MIWNFEHIRSTLNQTTEWQSNSFYLLLFFVFSMAAIKVLRLIHSDCHCIMYDTFSCFIKISWESQKSTPRLNTKLHSHQCVPCGSCVTHFCCCSGVYSHCQKQEWQLIWLSIESENCQKMLVYDYFCPF